MLDERNTRRVAAEANVTTGAVVRAFAGKTRSDPTLNAIVLAMRVLGFKREAAAVLAANAKTKKKEKRA